MTLLADATDFFGTEALQDPYPLYDRMRDDAAVQRIGDSGFYAVCGWDAVIDAVDRVEDFSSNLTATMVYHDDGTVTPFDMGTLGDPMHALATADDPVHDVHRKMLLPHLSQPDNTRPKPIMKPITAIRRITRTMTQTPYKPTPLSQPNASNALTAAPAAG